MKKETNAAMPNTQSKFVFFVLSCISPPQSHGLSHRHIIVTFYTTEISLIMPAYYVPSIKKRHAKQAQLLPIVCQRLKLNLPLLLLNPKSQTNLPKHFLFRRNHLRRGFRLAVFLLTPTKSITWHGIILKSLLTHGFFMKVPLEKNIYILLQIKTQYNLTWHQHLSKDVRPI